jgi:hypothetical protein
MTSSADSDSGNSLGRVITYSIDAGDVINVDYVGGSGDGGIETDVGIGSVREPLGAPLATNAGHRYWVLVLLIIPVLTVFGNVLVVLSVVKEKSLRSVTNYFIVSLAIADIAVAILVMPFAVYVEVGTRLSSFDERVDFCLSPIIAGS